MRCGNFGYPYSDTIWPDDYLIEIAPGKTYEETTYIPFVIPEDGQYTIYFEYIFTPKSELLPTGEHRYPKELWRGKAKSNSIRMTLKARHDVVG